MITRKSKRKIVKGFQWTLLMVMLVIPIVSIKGYIVDNINKGGDTERAKTGHPLSDKINGKEDAALSVIKMIKEATGQDKMTLAYDTYRSKEKDITSDNIKNYLGDYFQFYQKFIDKKLTISDFNESINFIKNADYIKNYLAERKAATLTIMQAEEVVAFKILNILFQSAKEDFSFFGGDRDKAASDLVGYAQQFLDHFVAQNRNMDIPGAVALCIIVQHHYKHGRSSFRINDKGQLDIVLKTIKTYTDNNQTQLGEKATLKEFRNFLIPYQESSNYLKNEDFIDYATRPIFEKNRPAEDIPRIERLRNKEKKS